MYHARTRPRAHESGFTLVEVLVVLLILAIVFTIGVMSIGGARKAGQLQEGLATAHAYADGIDAFAREHSGRFPGSIGDPKDWPNKQKGPTDPALGNKLYMARIPESVQSGNVVLGKVDPKLPSITYEQRGPNGRAYRLIVTVPDRDPCAIYGGVDTPTDIRSCGKR